MHIFKAKWLQIASFLVIILLILGCMTTKKVLMAHADSASGNSVSLQTGETAVTGEITNYSGNDGGSNGVFPPSTAIDWPASAGYPTVHNSVGGTGTFADPITVAINSKNGPSGDVPNSSDYHIGEKFYVPQLHLYFVAEDSCNVDIDYAACTDSGNMQDNSTKLHMDLFDGNITDSSLFTNQQNCETSFGSNIPVIANAGPGHPMPDQYPQGTSLFVAPNNCIGATLWNTYSGWTIGTGTTSSVNGVTSTPTDTATNTQVVDDSVQGSGQNQFNYSGTGWKHCQNCDNQSVGFSNGSNSWDDTAGDSVTVTFTGTQINFYGVVGPAHGIGQVSIDGGAAQQIDFYAAAEAGNTLLYTSTILPAGQHTFKLTVTGSKNDASACSYVNPDRVEIISDTTTLSSPSSSSSVLAGIAGTSKNTLDSTASDSNWKMIWNDDFTGSAIDTNKWTVRNYSAGLFNNEQECYKDDGTHTRIDGTGANSHLVLEADQQSNDSSCPYISGRLDTQGKYAVQPPTSGKPVRVEASVQLPEGGPGMWPAFWMLGQNIDSVGWPDCGEIDIMENVPELTMSTIQSTVHGLNNKSSDQQETLPNGKFSDGYHLIAMDWYTDHIVFSVDGRATSSIDTAQLGGDQVFNQPFFILLNLAVGGDWPGEANSSTPFPQQMNVAFVRVYQHN